MIKKDSWVLVLGLMVGVLLTLPARATLIDRGNGLIYDDVLDITWLQDAGQGGNRTWDDAVAWADTLVFQGFDNWRLPSISVSSGLPIGFSANPVDCATATEVECRDNELGYMYYQNLGGMGDNLTGNQGLIRNIQPFHWSGTALSNPWTFLFFSGEQVSDVQEENTTPFAWAVRPGDVLATVPEPTTGLLLAAGLAGLGWSRRRRRPRHR